MQDQLLEQGKKGQFAATDGIIVCIPACCCQCCTVDFAFELVEPVELVQPVQPVELVREKKPKNQKNLQKHGLRISFFLVKE